MEKCKKNGFFLSSKLFKFLPMTNSNNSNMKAITRKV